MYVRVYQCVWVPVCSAPSEKRGPSLGRGRGILCERVTCFETVSGVHFDVYFSSFRWSVCQIESSKDFYVRTARASAPQKSRVRSNAHRSVLCGVGHVRRETKSKKLLASNE